MHLKNINMKIDKFHLPAVTKCGKEYIGGE